MRALGLRGISIDVALSFGRQFLAGLLQLVIVLLVSRLLGPEGAGSYALALLLPTLLASLMNLGLASANVYFIASGQFSLPTVWAVSRNLGVLMGLLGIGVGAGVIAFSGEVAFPGVAPVYLWLALAVFPASLMVGMVGSLFQGLQDFRIFNLLVLQQPLVALCCLILLWAFDAFTLSGVLVCVALSHIFALLIGLLLVQRRIPVFGAGVENKHYLGNALRYGYKAHLSNLVTLLIYRSDVFILNLFAGPAAAGIYTIAVRLVEQLWMISTAVSTVIFPRLASMVEDESGRNALTPLIARLVLWMTFAAAGVLGVIATPLIKLLFGVAFVDAAAVLMVLLPGVVVFSCARVLANDCAARGLVHINLFLALGMLGLNIVGNLLLIPDYGVMGAALATTVSYSIIFFLRLLIQQRITSVRWWRNLVPHREDFVRLARFRARPEP